MKTTPGSEPFSRRLTSLLIASVLLTALFLARVTFAQSARQLLDEAAIENELGFEEDNKILHFRRAAELCERALEQSPHDARTAGQLACDAYRARERAFADYLPNVLPLAHLINSNPELRSQYSEALQTAVRNAVTPIVGSLRASATGFGQIGVIVLQDGPVAADALEHTIAGLQKTIPLAVLSYEQLGLGPLTAAEALADVPRLERIRRQLRLRSLAVLVVRQPGQARSMAAVTLSAYLLLDTTKPLLARIADETGFGENTAAAFSRGVRLSIFVAFLLYIPLLAALLISIRKANKDIFGQEPRQVMIFIVALFLLGGLGLLAGAGLDLLPSFVVQNWQEPAANWPLLLALAASLGYVVIAGLVVFVLTKFVGFVALLNFRSLTPLLFLSFGAGLAIWFIFRFEYFESLFAGSITALDFLAVSVAAIGAGGITGLGTLRLLDRGTSDYLRLVASLVEFTISLLTVALTSVYFYSAAEIPGPAFLIGPLLLIVPIEAVLQRRKQRAAANKQSAEPAFELPESIAELQAAIASPRFQRPDNFDEACKAVRNALIEEGGIVVLEGAPGAGKKRFASELVKHVNASTAKSQHHYAVSVQPETDEEAPFSALLRSMADIPEIQVLNQTLQRDRKLQSIGKDLADPLGDLPFIGGLLSMMMRADTSAFQAMHESGALQERIAYAILRLSRTLLSKNPEAHLIFVLEDFQKFPDAYRDLILTIQKLLRHPVISPEKNPVAFVLTHGQARLDGPALTIPGARALQIAGIRRAQAEALYFEDWRFARQTRPVFEAVFKRLITSDQQDQNDPPIPPGDFLASVAAFAQTAYLSLEDIGFVIKGGLHAFQLPLAGMFIDRTTRRMQAIERDEIDLLECAAAAGLRFSAEAVASCLERTPLEIHRVLHRIERESGLIFDALDGALYEFESPLVRDVLISRLQTRGETAPQLKQILAQYHQRFFNFHLAAISSGDQAVAREQHVKRAGEYLLLLDPGQHAAHAGLLAKAAELAVQASEWDTAVTLLKAFAKAAASKESAPATKILSGSEEFRAELEALVLATSQTFQFYPTVFLDSAGDLLKLIQALPEQVDHLGPDGRMALAEIGFLLKRGTRESPSLPGWSQEFLEKLTADRGDARALFWSASLKKLEDAQDPECRSRFLKVLEISQDVSLRSRALNSLGEIALNAHEFDSARQYFDEAFSLKQKIQDRLGLAMVRGWQARVALRLGDFEQARKHNHDCIKYNAGNDYGLFLCFDRQAHIELAESHHDFSTVNALRAKALSFLESPKERSRKIVEYASNFDDGSPAASDATRSIRKSLIALLTQCVEHWDDPAWAERPGRSLLEALVRRPGARSRGSYVKGLGGLFETVIFLMEREWTHLHPKESAIFRTKEYDYFQAPLPPEQTAYSAAITYKDARERGFAVEEREGRHGPELVAMSRDPLPKTRVLHAVVGKNGLLATWHPGEFMVPYPESVSSLGDRSQWQDIWAVKIVRGEGQL